MIENRKLPTLLKGNSSIPRLEIQSSAANAVGSGVARCYSNYDKIRADSVCLERKNGSQDLDCAGNGWSGDGDVCDVHGTPRRGTCDFEGKLARRKCHGDGARRTHQAEIQFAGGRDAFKGAAAASGKQLDGSDARETGRTGHVGGEGHWAGAG